MTENQLAQNRQSKPAASYSTKPGRAVKITKISRPQIPQLSQRGIKRLGLVLVLSLLIGFGGGWLGAYSYSRVNDEQSSVSDGQKFISSESELISSIAQDVGESVVSIYTQSQVSQTDIFGVPRSSEEQSAGTGFIISSDGVILTNRHVVPAGVSRVNVTLSDGSSFENVEVIGRTSQGTQLDVAFLKITELEGKKLSPVKLGSSAGIEVGDKVIAIGNALGQFENTVTSGIISGYGRDVTASDGFGGNVSALSNLFQTDAAINQGNSGGPLVNTSGEVIGVNTAVAGDAQNIGFAIPIDDVKGLIKSVLEKGELQQPYLGVRYVPLTDDLATQNGLSAKRGAYILPSTDGEPSVIPDSPAARAGLQEGDIIIKVNDITIDDNTSLGGALTRFQVDDTVKLTVVRGEDTVVLDATLQEVPG